MAELNRSAKSGSDWTKNELAAYNITVELQDADTFFGMHDLPHPTVNSEVLTVTNASDAVDDNVYELLHMMDLATSPIPTEESAVVDFVVLLLRALRYDPRPRTLRTRKDIPFLICGENRHTKTDVCIVDANNLNVLLLVHEDKRHLDISDSDPEPQLIAEAIATFAQNNLIRTRTLGLPPLCSKVIPAIIMRGTSPMFYKIMVTAALVASIETGIYPCARTTVYMHLPEIPRPTRRWTEGMKPLDNRQVILSCYEAFKQFVN